jgi:hypothetical protein
MDFGAAFLGKIIADVAEMIGDMHRETAAEGRNASPFIDNGLLGNPPFQDESLEKILIQEILRIWIEAAIFAAEKRLIERFWRLTGGNACQSVIEIETGQIDNARRDFYPANSIIYHQFLLLSKR